MSGHNNFVSNETSKLCEELQKLGYTDTTSWLAVVLFARNIVTSFSILNQDQKKQAQQVVFNGIAAKDSSTNGFYKIIHGVEDIVADNVRMHSLKSQLALYKSSSHSLAESISDFISNSLSTSTGRDKIVTEFERDVLSLMASKDDANSIILKLRDLVTTMLQHYRDEAKKWEREARKFEQLINIDPMLNTLHNRRSLDNYLTKAIKKSKSKNTPLSLLMIDIDDFKKTVNDVYGHPVGDDVLRTLAKILTDIASKNGFFAARYGGDELVLVCPLTGDEAENHADAIRYAVQNYEFRSRVGGKLTDTIVRFTVSIGVAEYHGDWTADDLLNSADQAMYHGKCKGKNRVSRYCLLHDEK